jgi:DNA-3-methyladenine glycosylase II
MHPDDWQKATKHLSKHCPTMKRLITQYKGEQLTLRGNGFYTLLRSVVGQQISVKAADAIWGRLEKAVHPLTPENLLKKRDTTLRKLGLSTQKALYAKNVARFFAENHVDAAYWAARTDEDILAELTQIKGIGSWTVEMFLIFHLARPDVFPVKDLGVLKAIDIHYAADTGGHRLKPKEYLVFSERWAPYRTVASWYLWRALDPVPVAY